MWIRSKTKTKPPPCEVEDDDSDEEDASRLARSSVALSQLGDLHVVELMATALESMVNAGVLVAQATPEDLLDRRAYEARSRLKTSSLIADACRSAAILAGHAEDSVVSNAVHSYADALGLAYQTMADSIAYAELGDDATLLATAALPPYIMAADACPDLRAQVLSATPMTALTEEHRALVAKHAGTQKSTDVATHHARRAAKALEALPPSEYRDALHQMALYAIQPDQRGLQREKYTQQQAAALKSSAASASSL